MNNANQEVKFIHNCSGFESNGYADDADKADERGL